MSDFLDSNQTNILKDRLCSIVSKMKCSENEKNLALLDIKEVIDMLDQAESDFWDLDGYIADIKDQDDEIESLNSNNKKLFESNEILKNRIDDVIVLSESMIEILKEKGGSDE